MEKLKQQIVQIGKKLSEKGLSPGFSGNISVRYGRYFLVTPSGYSLGDFDEDNVVLIDENARTIDGKQKPTSESKLHIEIYKLRQDIQAIIHCHAPKTSAFAVTDTPLSLPVLTEGILHLGDIPVAPYHLFSTQKIADVTSRYFDKNDVVLMQNHGVVVGGKDLKEAFYKVETAEYVADIIINAKILGNIKLLTPDEIEEVKSFKTNS